MEFCPFNAGFAPKNSKIFGRNHKWIMPGNSNQYLYQDIFMCFVDQNQTFK